MRNEYAHIFSAWRVHVVHLKMSRQKRTTERAALPIFAKKVKMQSAWTLSQASQICPLAGAYNVFKRNFAIILFFKSFCPAAYWRQNRMHNKISRTSLLSSLRSDCVSLLAAISIKSMSRLEYKEGARRVGSGYVFALRHKLACCCFMFFRVYDRMIPIIIVITWRTHL